MDASSTQLPWHRSRFSTVLMLTGMILFTFFLSYFFFSGQSLRLDESQSIWQTSRAPLDILRLVAGDVHVPLYHLLLHYWRLFFGDTVAIARTMSLFFLAILIPATYFLGKLAYNRRVGLYAALLISISPFMNWYGNEARMYTLFTLLVVLNQYFFIKIFKDKSERAWWGYAITALFGIYSHYFFFLNLAAQAIFYFIRREDFPARSFKRLTIIAVCVVVAIAPWLYLVHTVGAIGSQTPLLEAPTSVNVFSTFAQFIFGFQDDHVNTVFLSLWPVGLIFAFISIRSSRKVLPVTIYLLTTLIASVVLAFIVSVTIQPVFVSRYLSFTIPSLYLLLSAHVDGYKPRYRSIVKIALVILVLATLVVEIVSAATPVKENYREATYYLNDHVQPQDVVIISAPFTIYPVEYYYNASAPIDTLPIWNRDESGPIPAFSKATLPTQVGTLVANHQNVWLLLSYDQGYESTLKLYFDTHYQRLQQVHFSSDLNLYEYKLNYTAPYPGL